MLPPPPSECSCLFCRSSNFFAFCGAEEWPAFGQLCSFCVVVVLSPLQYMSDTLRQSRQKLFSTGTRGKYQECSLSMRFPRRAAYDCFVAETVSGRHRSTLQCITKLHSLVCPSPACFPGYPPLPSPDFWRNGDALLCRRRRRRRCYTRCIYT